MAAASPRDRWLTLPNLLTLSRLPLAVLLFVCIDHEWWLAGLVDFVIASLTDWADGFLARRLGQLSALGRSLDPLIDKVLVGGSFIFLIPVKESDLTPWMVTVVIGRELLITGLRGIMEAQGVKFGADMLGKIKMVLQCAVLIVVLVNLWMLKQAWSEPLRSTFWWLQIGLIYVMLAATVFSGAQYILKAVRQYR
ncbi:MAG TPA: CDP-diacylglycerol--glycerol-3-phosphate 3-phosphatidyltransferase [Gemmataceae bacterium]|nr:CDP-diacylglycerol--glycerol-3-phosphate 3-phosphatidyltransferase [Gemmataceae bacterium]